MGAGRARERHTQANFPVIFTEYETILHDTLPACRRLLFPLLHAFLHAFVFPRARKEIGDVCTQAT